MILVFMQVILIGDVLEDAPCFNSSSTANFGTSDFLSHLGLSQSEMGSLFLR